MEYWNQQASITVQTAATYTVTTTNHGCTSLQVSDVAALKQLLLVEEIVMELLR
jgi:hypothetical protein